jgi:type II secretory pathway component GspD/PulD (secretin)
VGFTQEKTPQEKVIEDALKDLGIISISKKNAPIGEVIAELGRQTKINLVLDPKGITEQDRITIELKEVPFRTALETVIELAGLVVEEENANLIKIAKPPMVTFDLSDAPLKEVINIIAKLSGANIIVSPDIKGSVSATVKDVPWLEVLKSVVKTAGFEIVRERYGIIRIVDPKELRAQLETRVFKLRYIEPPPSYIAKIEESKYFKGQPREIKLEDFPLLKIIKTVMTKDSGGKTVGSLEFDPKLNAITVTDIKPILDQIDAILAKLDVEPEQVLIDATFVTTTNEDILNLGMSYSSTLAEGFQVGTTPSPTQKETRLPFDMGPGHGIRQYFLTNWDVQALFRIFKKDVFTKVDQRPTVVTLNNTDATIFVGESVPYAVSEAVQTAGSTGLTYSIKEGGKSPVKVGFQLLVIPHIVEGSNMVALTIIPQNEFLSGTTSPIAGFERFTIAGQTIDLPRISQTTVVTRMMIESGRTGVIGGLVTNHISFEDKKIPLLGDIPVLGYLFKSRSDSVTQRHLLVFVTPTVVRGGKVTQENIQSMLKTRSAEEEKRLLEIKQEELKKILEERRLREEKEIERLKQK